MTAPAVSRAKWTPEEFALVAACDQALATNDDGDWQVVRVFDRMVSRRKHLEAAS